MTRQLWFGLALTTLFLGGCSSLSEVRDRFGRTDSPPIVQEIAEVPSVGGPAVSAPVERSPVYQSQSIQRREGSGESKPDGWSVPESPIRYDETDAIPAPELKTNASPDLGIVKSIPSSSSSAVPEVRYTPPVVAQVDSSPPAATSPNPSPGYVSRTVGSSTLPEIVAEPSTPPLPLSSTVDSPPLARVDPPWVTDSPTYPNLDSIPSTTFPPPASTTPPASSTYQPQIASSYPPVASAVPAPAQQTGIVRGGQPAPTLALTTLDGQAFNLEAHRGRVVVLDFWYSTCGPCMRSMSTLAQIRNQYREDQLVILGMNADRNQRDAIAAIRRSNHPWPQVFTPNQKPDPRRLFSVNLYPTFIVVDQAGNIQYRGSSVQLVASKVGELVTTPSIPAGGQMGAGYLAGLN